MTIRMIRTCIRKCIRTCPRNISQSIISKLQLNVWVVDVVAPWSLLMADEKPIWWNWHSGSILCMHSANERRLYIVTSSLIGLAHTQNGPWRLNSLLQPFQYWAAHLVIYIHWPCIPPCLTTRGIRCTKNLWAHNPNLIKNISICYLFLHQTQRGINVTALSLPAAPNMAGDKKTVAMATLVFHMVSAILGYQFRSVRFSNHTDIGLERFPNQWGS